jgi:adenylate kinase
MKLIFLGPPNVGKGTYADHLAAKEKILHISTGELLREEVKKGGALAKQLKSYMDKGALVPDEIVIRLLKDKLSQPEASRGFIIDGFPRSIVQAEILEKEGIKADYVINYTSPEDLLIRRAITRRVCRSCGAIYNLLTNKPKNEGICDKCKGELYQRDDDTEETVKKRLKLYKDVTLPLIKYYKKKKILLDVDGSKSIAEVFDATVKALEKAGQ